MGVEFATQIDHELDQEIEQEYKPPYNPEEMKASIRAWLPKTNHPNGYKPEDARKKFSGIVYEGF